MKMQRLILRRMRWVAVLATILLVANDKGCTQDIHFTQFYELVTNINPSTVGAYNGDIRAMAGHKQQWKSVGGGYNTSFASLDMPLGKSDKGSNRMALGAGFYSDKAGIMGFGTQQVFLNYAYPVKLNDKNILSAGIALSYNQVGLDRSKLKWDDQYVDGSYDPANATNESYGEIVNNNFVDGGIGFLWRQNNSKINWSVGGSAFHLAQPDNSLGGGKHSLDRKYIVHGEAELPRGNYSLLPKFMVAMQGEHMEIIGGTMAKIQIGSQSLYTNARTASAILGGVFYRYNDAVIAAVQYSFNQMFMAGVSYDFNVSKFQRASQLKGGFEVTLKYVGAFEVNRQKL